MGLRKSRIHVEIGKGMMRVGNDVYPLRQIARVGKRRLDPDPGEALADFFKAIPGIFVLGFIVLLIWDDSIACIAMIIGIAIATIPVIFAFRKPSVFGLVINTSGTDRAAVWSTDENEIEMLIVEVTKAIAEPHRPTNVFNVNNHVSDGDVNQVFGDISGGNANVGSQ